MHAFLITILLLLLLEIPDRKKTLALSLNLTCAARFGRWGIGRRRDLQRQIDHVRKVE